MNKASREMRNGMRSGFVVHPSMTGNNKYHASYGSDNNATNRSFNTKSEAVAYLRKKGISHYDYDGLQGFKRQVETSRSSTNHKPRSGGGLGFLGGGGDLGISLPMFKRKGRNGGMFGGW